MSQMDVDTQTLRQVSSKLADLGDRVGAAWDTLLSSDEGMCDLFGDDDVGGLIGESYAAAEGIGDDSLVSVVNGLYYYSDGLSSMADQYDGAETDNVDDIDSVGEKV